MIEGVSGFDWDEGNLEKCKKHGVSQEEIESLFKSNPLVAPDIKHSSDLEARYLAIGVSTKGKHIFVAFTFRIRQGEKLIRPISTRYMHQKEVQQYEQNFTKDDNR